ncbi:hypothetical protein [Plantibacter sp. RU18]|uniref:hypothetical protein n=1 Tax=Plantibacter sp. RU18 TaxID=3158143 RepID=UPI002D084E2F|nr:hypothetical protein [Gemmatimonadaceae bacterium]
MSKMLKSVFASGLLALLLTAGIPAAAHADQVATVSVSQSQSDGRNVASGTPASANSTDVQPDERKPCLYEYGSRCVTWVTNDYTCKNIFQITTNYEKRKACSIYATVGIVTVWP